MSTAKSFLTRSAAAQEAHTLGYRAFRTVLEPASDMWKARYEPGDPLGTEWQAREWVHHTEVTWEGEGEQRTRVGVLVVTITLDELRAELEGEAVIGKGDGYIWIAFGDGIPDMLAEPITPSLWMTDEEAAEEAKPKRGASGGASGRVVTERSTAESPVKTVHRIADEMPNATRAEVVAACIALGVNKSTAGTQYYHWKKAREVAAS